MKYSIFAIICIIALVVILVRIIFQLLYVRKWRVRIETFMYSSATLVGVYELYQKGLVNFSKEDVNMLLEEVNKNIEFYDNYFSNMIDNSNEKSNKVLASLEEVYNYLRDIATDLRRYVYWGDEQSTKEKE